MELQLRKKINGVSLYGVINEGKFIGVVGVFETKAVSMLDFDNSLPYINKLYQCIPIDSPPDKRKMKQYLSDIISIVSPVESDIETHRDVPTHYEGLPPEGIGRAVKGRPGKYVLNLASIDKKLRLKIQDDNKTNNISFVTYDFAARSLSQWKLRMSKDFSEILGISKTPINW